MMVYLNDKHIKGDISTWNCTTSHNPSLPSPENYPVKASNKNAAFLWETNVHVDVLCAQSETLSNTALETHFLKKKISAQNFSVLFSHLCSALFSDYQQQQ